MKYKEKKKNLNKLMSYLRKDSQNLNKQYIKQNNYGKS